MSPDSRTTASPALIVGRYRVITLIAHGGMGSLYLAHDPAIDRTIAIKLLQKGFDDESALERFAREARAAGRLRHPNIVTVFDVGQHDGQPFIAMEYVPGETLDQLIRRRTPLPFANRLQILEGLCSGLHFAHTQGIVHRDIKPANVILDVDGTIKILDFGLAHAPDSAITRAGDQLGTLNYMAPEQVLGAQVDHRCDIYAVGALAYELMSYTRAFPGTVQDGVMYRILSAAPTPLETVAPDLDPAIVKIVERALLKEPDRRYQSLEEMRDSFATVRHRLEQSEPAPTLAGVARDSTPIVLPDVPSSAPTFVASSGRDRRSNTALPPRRTRRIAAIGAGVVAFSAILAVALYPRAFRRESPAAVSVGQRSGTAPPVQTAPPPSPAASAPRDERSKDQRDIEERLNAIRATARRQAAARQRSQLLDTLNAGLTLDARDVELNQLIDDVKRSAKQAAGQARANASQRGANDASVEFRDGRAREREGESFDRAGDRSQSIRAFWAAADLYERASAPSSGREAETAAAPVTPLPPPLKPDSPRAADPPPPAAPSPGAPIAEKPAQPAPPATPRLERGSSSEGGPSRSTAAEPAVDATRDARTNDVAAIQAVLNQYAEAYRNRDVSAVRKVLPSLSPQQLRGLDKDFSEYRSYTVEIAQPRISIDRDTATATCQVTRSFVTKNGVAGGHTVATTFHLRKTDSTWVIERLDSR